MKPTEKIMRTAPVISVLVMHDVADAVPVAEALVAGGLPVLEVTLRTDCALDSIEQMRKLRGDGSSPDQTGLCGQFPCSTGIYRELFENLTVSM